MSAVPLFICEHGRTDSEACDPCDIMWSESCIETAKRDIAKHERKIVELRGRIARSDAERTKVSSQASGNERVEPKQKS